MRASSRLSPSTHAKPRVQPPTPPPTPVEGVPGPTFVASDGLVWRRSMLDWWPHDRSVWERLLVSLRADAENTQDWWHKRAAELADELEAAIAEAKTQRKAA